MGQLGSHAKGRQGNEENTRKALVQSRFYALFYALVRVQGLGIAFPGTQSSALGILSQFFFLTSYCVFFLFLNGKAAHICMGALL